MSVKLGTVKGALSLGSARIVTNILNAATLLILARLLSPSDFGIAAIAAAVLHFVMSLTQVSIFQALVQREDATREHIDSAWTLALIRTLLILAFFVLASWPLSIIYEDPIMIPVFIVTGFTGAVTGLFNPHMNLATKQMRFGPLTIFQIFQKASGLITAIVLALIFESFWAIIIGNLIGAVGGSLLSYFLIPYRPRLTLVKAKDIWGFSSWMFLNQLCETINWRFDQLAVSVVVPKAAMGHYAMADSLAVIPSRETVQPLREALFPGLAAINADRGRLASSCLRAQSTIGFIAMPLGIGLALIAEPAVAVLLGTKWLMIVPLVQVFSIAYVVTAITSCFASTAMAMGETRFNFQQQFWTMVFRVPLVVIGLMTAGIMGAAVGRLLSEIVWVWISLRYMKKLLGVGYLDQLKSHGTTFIALGAMSLAVLAATPYVNAAVQPDLLRMIALVVIGGAAFVASALAVWFIGGRGSGPVHEIVHIAAKFLPQRGVAAEGQS